MSWVLWYTRAGSRIAWLVVDDVPEGVKRSEVLDALETWRRWSAYAPGVGRLTLSRLSEGRESFTCSAVPWGDLAPELVRTTVELDGRLHARVVLAARAAGITQQAFITATLGEVLGGGS